MNVTLEQVYELAEQLTPEERELLVERIQATLPLPLDYGVTSEELLAEMNALRIAGAFDNVESLYGKYVNPNIDISEEELNAYLHEISTEWEQEMDELIDNDTN